MNIQIITSSYPAFEGDPGGTAGVFVESFVNELASLGHRVVVQPVKRKEAYHSRNNVIIEPIPWGGGDQELASMNFFDPGNWLVFWRFFEEGKKNTISVHQKYSIDRTLCMWVLPCGLFGYWIKKHLGKDYDVWALGSDIWKVRKVPIVGNYWINRIVRQANGVFADGIELCRDVKHITKRECRFLASTRVLPPPDGRGPVWEPRDKTHLLFVGRYHKNKGPDLLLKALALLPDETRQKVRVHLFGLGDMESTLKAYCQEHGLVGFVNVNGPIKAQELANCLKQAAFLLIPSRVESIPVIFSDAIQSGTPVISMPVGDLTGLINAHGCGVLAESVSPEAFASAIEEAVKKKKEDFAKNVTHAYNKFKISHSIDQWLNNKDR